MIKTFKYRLKTTMGLPEMAGAVNFVWNYCNQTSFEYLEKKGIWLTKYDLQRLTKGCSSDLGLNSQTIQAISHRHAERRVVNKKPKLSWRSLKRSLGWVPFNGQSVVLNGDSIVHNGFTFRMWFHRPIEGKIKSGSFTQDSRGRWYVSLCCETLPAKLIKSGGAVGVDLGLKTLVTLSNGIKLTRANLTTKYAARLAMAQRARKPRLVRAIHAKITNTRRDWNHKETTKLVNQYDRIIVGNVSPSRLKRTRMAKSVSDASWFDFKTMLSYKAIALGVVFKEVNESYSTVTCSDCFERSGPSGLSALGVREWVCKSCGSVHDRDVNAAQNILRFGHESPIKGTLEVPPK